MPAFTRKNPRMCSSSPRPAPAPVIRPTAPQAPQKEVPKTLRVLENPEVKKRRLRRLRHGSLLQTLKIPLDNLEQPQ